MLRLVGDATHDETHQRLKKLRIGYAGCYFLKSEWQTAMLPSIEVLCHDGTQDAVDLALRAIAYVSQQRHKLDLAEHVLEWFWDGKVE